jgi:hypothetical protein
LVSGDVQSRIAVYDEKIRTAKENIDANRKALKQLDESVDQVMARSSSETGADKAVGLRRAQQKERARLQSEIQAEQTLISSVTQERAPIAAEVRKVEAEVGPIKYIAQLFYGENTDANILEKSVIWVTVLIVAVLDPLAVVLLLASQYSFQKFRKQLNEEGGSPPGPVVDVVSPEPTVAKFESTEIDNAAEYPEYEDDDEPLTDDQLSQIKKSVDFSAVQELDQDRARLNFNNISADNTTYNLQRPIFRNKTFMKSQDSYVQNEEQLASNLWAKTTGKE